jgi:peptide/nickel transport system substrate-binding protein
MPRTARHPFRIALAVGACALAVFVQTGASARGQEGGVLKITFSPAAGPGTLDPALEFTQPGWALLDATCARLMSYPDKPVPEAYRLQPEVAAGYKVSSDLKTYTFTLRSGFRFSDGSPVRASAFAQAINRGLSPVSHAPGAMHMRDIVGAAEVLDGKRQTPRGVVARGNTLIVRFKKPAPDFPARTAMPFFCAVPPNLPPSEEGAILVPSAGPYYFREHRPDERVVIRRNPHYGGARKVHLEGFDVDLRGGSPTEMIRRVERDEADWGHMLAGVYFGDPTLNLIARYGINKPGGEFHIKPGLTLRMLAFNASRPLFRNNPKLRRAINFALDRRELATTGGGIHGQVETDQYLPPSVPGFSDADVYPLAGPDLARARALARGNLRGGRVELLVTDFQLAVQSAQLVKQQLARIGLEVVINKTPVHIATAAYLEKLASRHERWDMALVLWTPSIPEPHAYLNQLLESQILDGRTLTRFRSTEASNALQRAAGGATGNMRSEAYAELDELLAGRYAPLAAVGAMNEVTLVSNRVGCIVLRPVLDLAVACLEN